MITHNSNIINKVSFPDYYAGPLSDHVGNDPEIGNLLKFLKNISKPSDVWLGENMVWPSSDLVVPENFTTYIFTFFGEPIDVGFLQEMDQKFKNKNLILISSSNTQFFYLNNFKIFYLEHLHKYKKFYREQNYLDLDKRKYLLSAPNKRFCPHRVVALAKLLEIKTQNDYELAYSFSTEQAMHDKKGLWRFIDTKYPDLVVTDKFVDIVDELLEGKYNHLYDFYDTYGWSPVGDMYENSIVNLVTESCFEAEPHFPIGYFSEKILKPLVSRMPYVLVGQEFSLQRLRNLGFLPYFDQSVEDTEGLTPGQRLNRIVELLIKISHRDFDLQYLQEIADFNHRYFFHGFYERATTLNRTVKQKILDHIESVI